MISEDAKIFGCSSNVELHARLTTPAACLGYIDEVTQGGENPTALKNLIQRDTVFRCHRNDPWLARQWIEYAAADRVRWRIPTGVDGVPAALAGQEREFGRALVAEREALLAAAFRVEGGVPRLVDPARRADVSEVCWLLRLETLRVWQSVWNYFTALNVSAFAWFPLRIALEDAYGHPRHASIRDRVRDAAFERLDLDGDEVPVDTLTDERSYYKDGVLYRIDEDAGHETWGNWTNAPLGGVRNAKTYGWMRKRLLRQRLASLGEPNDRATPMGQNRARQSLFAYWSKFPRWGFNARQMTFFRNAARDARVPAAAKFGMVPMHPYAFPFPGEARVRAHLWMYGGTGDLPWTHDGGITSTGYGGDTDQWGVPSSKGYYDVLMAPMPGLRLVRGAPDGRDLSVVEYLARKTGDEIVREVMLHVVLANRWMMNDTSKNTDRDLYAAAQIEHIASDMEGDVTSLQEIQRTKDMANRVIAGVTTAATAINPIAGLVVGVAGAVASVTLNLALQATDETRYKLDVFGRLMPSFEVFSYCRDVEDLSPLTNPIHSEIIELTGAVDEEADAAALRARLRERRTARERELLAQGMLEVDERGEPRRTRNGGVIYRRDVIAQMADPTAPGTSNAFFNDGVLNAVAIASLRAAGRRSVILRGLDPATGARVFGDDGREFTTGMPESGRARWFDYEGAPAWVFGVPEGVRSLRVVVPDGPTRGVTLPEPPADGTPQARTAVITVGEAPPLTDPGAGIDLTLAGLPPGARVLSVDGRELTTQRTFRAPAGWSETGWTLGLPLGATRVVVVYPDGQRRTLPVPTEALRFEGGVAALTLDATAAPPVVVPAEMVPAGGERRGRALAIVVAAVVAAVGLGYRALRPSSPRRNPSPRSPRRPRSSRR